MNTKLFNLKTVSILAKSLIEEDKKQKDLILLARHSLDSCKISIRNNSGIQIAFNLLIENITFSIILPEVYTHKQVNLKMKLKHEMNLKVNVMHSSKKVILTFDNSNNNSDGDDCCMKDDETFFCKELPLNLVMRKNGG